MRLSTKLGSHCSFLLPMSLIKNESLKCATYLRGSISYEVVNQKGGTGKITTCEDLGADLVVEGKKVQSVDIDPQAFFRIGQGYPILDQLSPTGRQQNHDVIAY